MDQIDKILDVAGGGWVSVVVLVLLGGLFAWLMLKEKGMKDKTVNQTTQTNRQTDQANTVTDNQTVEQTWDNAQNEIDEIRKSEPGIVKPKRPVE